MLCRLLAVIVLSFGTLSGAIAMGRKPPPTKDTTAPSIPQNLTAKNLQTNAVDIQLAWNASTDNNAVTGYHVDRNGATIATTATPGYTDTKAAPHANVTYSVSAFDAAGNESSQSKTAMLFSGGPVSTGGSVETPGANATSFANPYYTCTRNFYIATTGNDANSTTQAQNSGTPWATIGNYETKIGASSQGGDCINVAAGTYTVGATQLNHGGSTSAANGYVVYRSTTLGGAHVISSCGAGTGCAPIFQLGNPGGGTAVAYIMIDGFEIDGNSNGGGVCISSEVLNSTASNHHIWVTNNNIHDCGQSGWQSSNGEWYWILHNNVHGNSGTSGFDGSGISVYEPHAQGVSATAFDNLWSPHHIIVNYNWSHDNLTDVNSTGHTDGNGIILDDWANRFGSTPGNSGVQYTTPGLVYGNLTTNNQAKGISAVWGITNLTIVANNTSYGNNTNVTTTGSQPRGEFYEFAGYGQTYSNNIAYAVPVNGVTAANTCAFNTPPPLNNVPYINDFINQAPGGTPIPPFHAPTYINEIAFGNGGTAWATTGCMNSGPPAATFSCTTNKCNTDPLFVTNGSNFALQGTSSAIGYITTITLPPAVTIIPDAGACNHTLSSCP